MKDYIKCRVQADEYWRIDLLALMWCGFSRQEIRNNLDGGRGSSSSVVIRLTEGCSGNKGLEFYKAFEYISEACEQDTLPHDGFGVFSRTVKLRDFRRWIKRNHPDGAAGEFCDEPEPGTESSEPTNPQVTRLSEMAWRSRVITVFEAAMIWCGIPEEDLMPAHLAYKGVYLKDLVDEDLHEEYVQKREGMKQAIELVVEGHRESVAKKQADEGAPKMVEDWTVSQGAFFDWMGSKYPDDAKNLRPHVAPIMTEAEWRAERAKTDELLAEAKPAIKSSSGHNNEALQDAKPPVQSALEGVESAARIQELESELADAHRELKELKQAPDAAADKPRKGKGANADLHLIGALSLYATGSPVDDIEPHSHYKGDLASILKEIEMRHPECMLKPKSVRDKINKGLSKIGRLRPKPQSTSH